MKSKKPLRYRYSGDGSHKFWQFVKACKNHDEMYSLGVVLQNLEDFVLKRMSDENPKFVEEEKFK